MMHIKIESRYRVVIKVRIKSHSIGQLAELIQRKGSLLILY